MEFEKHVIRALDNIDKKLDILQDMTSRQDEQIKQNCRNIEDVKKNIIPESIKASNTKIKYIIVSTGFSWAIGIIAFLLKTFVF